MDKRQHIDIHQPDGRWITIAELEHIASCDFCAEQFADYIEEQELITAPRNLQPAILARSRQMDVQVVAKTNHASKKLQLFYYSLKVSFAAAFALGLLLWTPDITLFSQMPSALQEARWKQEYTWYDRAQQFSDKLSDFSKQLLELEVSFYDKQEK